MCSNGMASAQTCDFEVNQTKIKGGCKSGSKVVPYDSKSDLPLANNVIIIIRVSFDEFFFEMCAKYPYLVLDIFFFMLRK